MSRFELIHGDCVESMREMPGASIDSIVTDPPYGLGFMGKKWDVGTPAVDVFAECLRVLKPGGHLLAFGGTRTYHRLVCAIEDAGFEIRDTIAWVYGSGFPKSRNVGNEAPEYEGWGTALKPAMEPICVARKPLEGTVAANVLAHGTGAINVDGCRVGCAPRPLIKSDRHLEHTTYSPGLGGSKAVGETNEGRWPANLIHDGSEEVLAAFPTAPGQQGALTGDEESARRVNYYGEMDRRHAVVPRIDSTTSAARFFYCAKAGRKDRNEGCEALDERPLHWSSGDKNPGSFQAEGTKKAARNNHPTVKPTDLMRYLCRLVTPPGGVVLDPFAGSGSTGKAAVLEGFRFIGIELDPRYCMIARARIVGIQGQPDLFSWSGT